MSTTVLTDGGNENPTVSGSAITTKNTGDLYFHETEEFIYGDDSKWHSLGEPLSTLGALAKKNNITWTGKSMTSTGKFTPAGSVSLTTGTDTSKAVTVTATTSTSGNYTPAGSVSQPTFSNGAISGSASYTPEGEISFKNTNKTVTVSKASSGTATYTPEGSVNLTNSDATVSISRTAGTSSNNTFSVGGTVTLTDSSKAVSISRAAGTSSDNTFQSAGTVSAPTISVATAGTTDTVKGVNAVINMVSALATAAPGATAPSNAITYYSVTDETLSLYQIGATKAAPVTTTTKTFKTGDASYSATQPTFTGSYHKLSASVDVPTSASLPTTYHKLSGSVSVPSSATFVGTGARLVTGNISVPDSATFTGTGATINVTGTATGTVSKPTFSGTKVQLAGTVNVPNITGATFTGTEGNVSVTGTTTGTLTVS